MEQQTFRSHQPAPMRKGSPDDFQTPPAALDVLLPYLKKDWVVWEPAEGRGNLSNALRGKGYTVLGSDIKAGQDFLKWQPPQFDAILTNPPYSLKQDFLERCYMLRRPFALLLPLTTFETAKRQKLFKTYGVQVVFMTKRINFETPSGKGDGAWFSTAWFTWGLGLPSDLNFEAALGNDKATLLTDFA